VRKALDRVKAALEAGSAYEAQQTVKATSRRLQARGKKGSAYNLLSSAAIALWDGKEFSCALDLGKALLQNCKDDGDVASDDEWFRKCVENVSLLVGAVSWCPPPIDSTTTSIAVRDQVASWAEASSAWAWRLHPFVEDTWRLQDDAGRVVQELQVVHWKNRAAVLYARGRSACGLCELLGDDVLPGEPDCDLYMSRYVLLLLAAAPQGGSASSDESEDLAQQRHLALRAHLAASHDLRRLVMLRLHRLQESGFMKCPLMNFCALLCEVLHMALRQRERLWLQGEQPSLAPQHLAAALRETYGPALEQDPELGELLDRVEVAYLGMRRERPGMGGMLGALMAAMGS